MRAPRIKTVPTIRKTNCIPSVGRVPAETGTFTFAASDGAGGSHVRKGDLLCTVDSEESAIALGGRFMQFYRENAKWRERTYDFVTRVGIERIRAVIVDDSEGLGAALDAAMQASVDAAYDPWKEATAPKTVNQFASAISAAEV